jgi:acyl carrier protein
MALGSEEIFAKVRQALVDALGRDEEEVTREARISADLGAESIDYLDIAFRLEKEFGVKIPRGELFPDNLATNEQYVQNGKLTSAGLQELRQRMPYADLSEFSKDPDIQKIYDLVTVGMLCKYVESKVAEKPA